MKILVVSRNQIERERVAASLVEVGHTVVATAAPEGLAAVVEAERPHVVVLDPEPPFATSIAAVRDLRATGGSGYLYVVLFNQPLSDVQQLLGYEAGIDHHLPVPTNPLQLHGCMLAAARVTGAGPDGAAPLAVRAEGSRTMLVVPTARAASSVDEPAADGLPTAPVAGAPTVLGVPVGIEIFGSPSWHALPNEIRASMSTFLNGTVEVETGGQSASGYDKVTGIILTNSQHGYEVRMTIGADVSAAKALAVHMCGQEDMELAIDLLREVANLIMGTVKTVLGKNSASFSAGLPMVLESAEFSAFTSTCHLQDAFTFALGEARIGVRVGVVASKRSVKLVVAKLDEGMVLASDVHGARGMMLVRRGTRLSAKTVERIRKALPADRLVDVTAVAVS